MKIKKMFRFHLRASPLRSLSVATDFTYPTSALFAAVSPKNLNLKQTKLHKDDPLSVKNYSNIFVTNSGFICSHSATL